MDPVQNEQKVTIASQVAKLDTTLRRTKTELAEKVKETSSLSEKLKIVEAQLNDRDAEIAKLKRVIDAYRLIGEHHTSSKGK